MSFCATRCGLAGEDQTRRQQVPKRHSARNLYAAFTPLGLIPNGIFTGIESIFRASDKRDPQCLTSFASAWSWADLPCSPLVSAAWGVSDMPFFDLILGASVAVGLFVYLGAALLRPDRF